MDRTSGTLQALREQHLNKGEKMRVKSTLCLLILVFPMILFVSGCQNAAAERLADDCWEFREQLLLENTNFSENEQELFLIEVMQARGFSEDEIIREIEKLRKLRANGRTSIPACHCEDKEE